ncbi:MAG: tetratricopeptide repeat protein [Candidatus Omnitrophica bacterium]|jgi:Tfp pilus assembly protein PilF|nr:tetratricopeptide repeat protein [Candidatus Omnitrophota bacterium]
MKKYLLVILVLAGLVAGLYVATRSRTCPLNTAPNLEAQHNDTIKQAYLLLKARKDKEALVIIEEVLFAQPENIDALWGKAEVLRRDYQFDASKKILDKILSKNPNYLPALNNLAFIKYKAGKLDEASGMIKKILNTPCLDKENEAFAYLTLGTINSSRTKEGKLFDKIQYGLQIKRNFDRANKLCPNLAEVHLCLGIFFLKAPQLAGGNLNKAIKELELAIKIAPDFAMANIRLAQAYQKKGNLEKYNYYFEKARKLDPEGKVLKECEI